MEIYIFVFNDVDSFKFKITVGSVKWVFENSEIVWFIKFFSVSIFFGGEFFLYFRLYLFVFYVRYSIVFWLLWVFLSFEMGYRVRIFVWGF